MSYWLWSNLSQYSDAELEAHKAALKKVIEYRRQVAYYNDNHWRYSFSGALQTAHELEQHITEIDEELERRHKSHPTGVPTLPRYLVDYYYYGNTNPFVNSQVSSLPEHGIAHAVPEYPPTDAQRLEDTQKELTNEKKTTSELRKRLKEVSKEVQEERNVSDKLQRLIDNHYCHDGSTFSDVEEDE